MANTTEPVPYNDAQKLYTCGRGSDAGTSVRINGPMGPPLSAVGMDRKTTSRATMTATKESRWRSVMRTMRRRLRPKMR